MAVPPSAELPRLVKSPEFMNLVERVKRELQVSIVANVKASGTANGSGAETPSEFSFKFRCQRSNSDFLITAREMLEQFLLNHNVHVYPSPTAHTHKRGDSFAEAFPHFDSKVLSTAKARGHGMCRMSSRRDFLLRSFSESVDMGRSDVMSERRLRMANSSPDVKALFNSPAYIYKLDNPQEPDVPYMPGPTMDYWTPLAPIVRALSFSFICNNPSKGETSGFWYPQSQPTLELRGRSQARLRLATGSEVEGANIKTPLIAKSCAVARPDLLAFAHHGVVFETPSAGITDDLHWGHGWQFEPIVCHRALLPKCIWSPDVPAFCRHWYLRSKIGSGTRRRGRRRSFASNLKFRVVKRITPIPNSKHSFDTQTCYGTFFYMLQIPSRCCSLTAVSGLVSTGHV